MIVTLLGTGNRALATAADLARAQHRVRLWAASPDAGQALQAARAVAQLERVTTDLAEAVAGAEMLVVLSAAASHEDLAKRLAPHLDEHQIVLLAPGNFGSYVMARDIARAGGRLPLAVAETGTPPSVVPAPPVTAVKAPGGAANLPVGVFPAARGTAVLARIAELFPAARLCIDALDAALTNVGPVVHPPIVLMNAGAIDQARFDIHAGTTASARRLMAALDRERIAARQGWGYPAPHYEIAASGAETPAMDDTGEPMGFEHRYVVEDVALGLSLLESAARTVGSDSPATTGLLLLFGVLLGRPLSGRGRALEGVGLGDLVRREIGELLHDGWMSPLWNRAIR